MTHNATVAVFDSAKYPAGNGCRLVWSNPAVENVTAARLSTTTGLIYLYARKADSTQPRLYVWYWTAVDFGTGQLV